jgi:(R,R)-butanediol dehydrogenase/meso-butanediol dehydrogenase/diacetyl reductase
MKAAVYHGRRDVRIENDASEWDHGPILCRPGVILGHEFVGRVVARGEAVTGLEVGDRVVSGAGISCGHCYWCRLGRTNLCEAYRTLGLQVDGGLAEYVLSPAAICHLVPAVCSDDAAAMAQPLAVALHALSRVGQRPDESIAVIGVGGIGSFVVAGASRRAAAGARVVAVDIEPERLATASALGASEVADAHGRDLAELLVIEASGAPHAPAAALAGTRRGGRTLLVGLHGESRALDLTDTILREIDIVTSVAHVCDTDIPEALDALTANGLAAVAMARTIPLETLVEEGLRPIAERRAPGKILVTTRDSETLSLAQSSPGATREP